jgi:periplasmic copper chaperone A
MPVTIKPIAAYVLLMWTIALFCVHSMAQEAPEVSVTHAWVRATAEGQTGTGGFMTLTAKQPMRLIGVASPAAGVGEVHEMKMEGNVMKMRALPGLDLPAGQAVELKSGGTHMMLMDLNQTLKYGTTVPVILTFADAQGKQSQLTVQMPVSFRAPKP